jgi:hypothetical protein
LAFLTLFSCRQQLEIDLPEMEVKPVVNCIFSPKTPFIVYLSLPASPTDSTYEYITGAEVTITGDDGSSYHLLHHDDGLYTDTLAFPKTGVQYTLNAQAPGYPMVTASDKIPVTATRIQGYTIETRTYSDAEDAMSAGTKKYQNLGLSLKNDLSVNDFMGISVVHNRVVHHYTPDSVYEVEEEGKYQHGYIESDNLAITNEGLENYDDQPGLLFRDVLLIKETEIIDVKVYTETASKFWLKFYLYSPSCFQYFRTWVIHDYTQSYDFWEIYEPLPMYSNIENGYGIFAGYTSIDYLLTKAGSPGTFEQ